MITKGERTELRSIVRQQFKVLRSEVAQRQKEMVAEVERNIGDRYQAHDDAYAKLRAEVHRIAGEADAAIGKLVHAAKAPLNFGMRGGGGAPEHFVHVVGFEVDRTDRLNERRIAEADIEVMVKAALLRLDRDEADLLKKLAIGALESAEAQAFLGGIPTVGELVSVERLRELERSIEQ